MTNHSFRKLDANLVTHYYGKDCVNFHFVIRWSNGVECKSAGYKTRVPRTESCQEDNFVWKLGPTVSNQKG